MSHKICVVVVCVHRTINCLFFIQLNYDIHILHSPPQWLLHFCCWLLFECGKKWAGVDKSIKIKIAKMIEHFSECTHTLQLLWFLTIKCVIISIVLLLLSLFSFICFNFFFYEWCWNVKCSLKMNWNWSFELWSLFRAFWVWNECNERYCWNRKQNSHWTPEPNWDRISLQSVLYWNIRRLICSWT